MHRSTLMIVSATKEDFDVLFHCKVKGNFDLEYERKVKIWLLAGIN